MKITIVKYLAGVVLGAGVGFAYWHYIGCHSGSCPITASPVNSSAYGALLGVLTLNLFDKRPPKRP